jgi:hypothetical protein
VLPLLCVGFLVFQFDRMNLASALTDGFADYIGIDQDTINLGNQLLFLGTVALEIPSNMLLQKVCSPSLSLLVASPRYHSFNDHTDWSSKVALFPSSPVWHRRHHADLHPE